MADLVEIMKRNFITGLNMLDDVVRVCPEGVWLEINGWFPFWQQVFHTLESVDFWFRESYECIYDENTPKAWLPDKPVSSELDENIKVFTESLTKKELKQYLGRIRDKSEAFFGRLDDPMLCKPVAEAREDFTYLDIINMQIRHVMYHVGHCMCVLREQAGMETDWLSHNER